MKFVPCLLAAAMMCVSAVAAAQSYPNQPVKVIVPFPPGGGGDALARAYSDALAKRLNQPVVIDNKPGADQVIATTALAKARPDGYTVMVTGSNSMVVHMALGRKLPYVPLVDVVPIARIAISQLALIANASIGVKDLKGLAETARAKPGSIKAAHIGTGAIHYLNLKLLEDQLGLSFLTVPYKGSAQAATAVAGGEVDITFTGPESATRLGAAGRTVTLGITGTARSPAVPTVPTLAEQGLKGTLSATFYLYVPRSTPPQVIDRLTRETRAVLAQPDVAQRIVTLGFESVNPGTAQAAVAEHEAAAKIIKPWVIDEPEQR